MTTFSNKDDVLTLLVHLGYLTFDSEKGSVSIPNKEVSQEYYTIVREMPAGKGFADICLIPRQLHADKPAVVIELKKDKDAQGGSIDFSLCFFFLSFVE